MVSTPSTSLRLELMATGDQSGTWGDTTNTNLGTLLEQAITGVLSVAQGDVANLTLSNTDYVSNQARNAVINVTGAMTAARNVVVPTANKLYTFINSTTGGFNITVKTAAGTGIVVPPGASMDVYCDGTNVVAGANYWNGATGGGVYVDAGAAVGPTFDLYRDSSSPAASDLLGAVQFNGRDSAGNKQEYASIQTVIVDATSTSEDGQLDFYATKAGAVTKFLSMTATATAFTGAASYTFDAAVSLSSSSAGTLLTLTSTDAGATVGPIINLYRDSATPAASDILGQVQFTGEDSAGNTQEYASIETVIADPTSTSEDGVLDIYLVKAGTRTRVVTLNTNGSSFLASASYNFDAAVRPSSNDGAALGASGTAWADLFLASGGVINWNAGDVTITHSANALAFAGASSGYSFDAAVNPSANDAAALGVSGTAWADLFLASGGVINWAAGDTTLTQSAGNLALGGSATDVVLDLSAANAGQVKFPATQNPSSNANTLDDYEEGTWTPAVNFGGGSTGITYTRQTGRYIKIGKMVTLWGEFILSAKGSSTGTATIAGMPFTSVNVANFSFAGAISFFAAMTGITVAGLSSDGNTTSLNLLDQDSGAFMTDANFNNTSRIQFSISYEAAN